MKLNAPRPISPLAIPLLASSFFLSTVPHRAAAEMPAGLEEALTGHAWSFPEAKPPMRFLIDGTVVDGNGTFRFWWDLEAIQQLMVREKQAELVANSTPGSPSVAPVSAIPTGTLAH